MADIQGEAIPSLELKFWRVRGIWQVCFRTPPKQYTAFSSGLLTKSPGIPNADAMPLTACGCVAVVEHTLDTSNLPNLFVEHLREPTCQPFLRSCFLSAIALDFRCAWAHFAWVQM